VTGRERGVVERIWATGSKEKRGRYHRIVLLVLIQSVLSLPQKPYSLHLCHPHNSTSRGHTWNKCTQRWQTTAVVLKLHILLFTLLSRLHHWHKAILIADVQCLYSRGGMQEFMWTASSDKIVNLNLM
jgi:hypothetical protein